MNKDYGVIPSLNGNYITIEDVKEWEAKLLDAGINCNGGIFIFMGNKAERFTKRSLLRTFRRNNMNKSRRLKTVYANRKLH